MSKLLTISIAAYNVEKTIEECLDSFLPCKHLEDLEILVINDGSHDRTVEIVSEYEKKYPSVIKLVNKENGGHGSTINKSLSLVTGKFYKVIDGDDWVIPGELDKLCDWLKSTDSDLVINAFKWCYPNNPYEEHDEKGFELHHKYTFEEMYAVHGTSTPIYPMTTITILTDKLRKVGMHIKEKCFYADNEFVVYCGMAADTISFDNSCAYQYRMGQPTQSVSSQGWYNHLEDYFAIFGDLLYIYAHRLEAFKGTSKDKYLIKFLESYYNGLYLNMVKNINRADKDYLLIDNLREFNNHYPEILHRLELNSMTARFVAKNPKSRIPFMRYFHKTMTFKILRAIKHLIKPVPQA